MDPTLDPTASIPGLPVDTSGEGADMTEEEFEEGMIDILGFMVFYEITVDLMQDNE